MANSVGTWALKGTVFFVPEASVGEFVGNLDETLGVVELGTIEVPVDVSYHRPPTSRVIVDGS
jgi:hypothetical protein